MRNIRFFFVVGVLALAGIFLGCNQELQGNCPRPIGVYKAEYSMLSGTCMPGYQPFALKFEADDQATTQSTEIRLADVIVTEVILKGCEIKVGQTVTGEGSTTSTSSTRSAIAGTLGVVDEGALSGTIQRTDFMEDGKTVRCTAQYDAWYTRDDLLLGAAARE
jgi:hypothetical protein